MLYFARSDLLSRKREQDVICVKVEAIAKIFRVDFIDTSYIFCIVCELLHEDGIYPVHFK